jgi:hypothetical protein
LQVVLLFFRRFLDSPTFRRNVHLQALANVQRLHVVLNFVHQQVLGRDELNLPLELVQVLLVLTLAALVICGVQLQQPRNQPHGIFQRRQLPNVSLTFVNGAEVKNAEAGQNLGKGRVRVARAAEELDRN